MDYDIVSFKIKGTCADNLFHILASNGYPVQMCTTNVRDVCLFDVKTEINELKESEDK